MYIYKVCDAKNDYGYYMTVGAAMDIGEKETELDIDGFISWYMNDEGEFEAWLITKAEVGFSAGFSAVMLEIKIEVIEVL